MDRSIPVETRNTIAGEVHRSATARQTVQLQTTSHLEMFRKEHDATMELHALKKKVQEAKLRIRYVNLKINKLKHDGNHSNDPEFNRSVHDDANELVTYMHL